MKTSTAPVSVPQGKMTTSRNFAYWLLNKKRRKRLASAGPSIPGMSADSGAITADSGNLTADAG